MKIKCIRYPEGCQLRGWNKMVFERRLQRALGSFFSVCDLDRCRAEVLGQEPDKERYEELSAFHCDSFNEMSAAEAQMLVDKTAQYVGVDISIKRASQVSRVYVALIGGILVGAAGASAIAAVKASKNTTSSLPADGLASIARLSPILPVARMPEESPDPELDFNTAVHPNRPGAIAVGVARMREMAFGADPEPVFNTMVRTDRAGATAMKLARAVKNDAGQFEVSLKVTPVEPGAGQ